MAVGPLPPLPAGTGLAQDEIDRLEVAFAQAGAPRLFWPGLLDIVAGMVARRVDKHTAERLRAEDAAATYREAMT